MRGRETQGGKMGLFGWRGLMAAHDGRNRRIALALLWVFSAALSFTQLGLAGIGLAGEYSCYMVVLLMPITLSAILLGPRVSTLTGLFAGTVAWLHARLMPLDYYEFTFVNAYSSVVAMTVMGFLLGMLFAKALRGSPPAWRRYLYIALVCVGMSWVYNVGFVVNAFVSVMTYMMGILTSLGEEVTDASIQAQMLTALLRVGDLSMQSWANALNMMASACLALFFHGRLDGLRERKSVRFVFGSTLTVVALMAFCLTAGLCFVGISMVEFARSSADMDEEIKYIAGQLDAGLNRARATGELLATLPAPADGSIGGDGELGQLGRVLSQYSVLDGYTPEEDGYVLIGYIDGNVTYLSDMDLGEGESQCVDLDDVLNADVIQAAKRSRETGKVVKAVYDRSYSAIVKATEEASDAGIDARPMLPDAEQGGNGSSELMYVKAAHNEETDDDIIMMVSSRQMYPTRNITMLAVSLSFGTLMALVFVVVMHMSDSIIIRHIRKANEVLTDIGDGNLDAKVDIHDTIEFDELSEHINTTVDALKGWIAEAQSKIETELATAKAIQESAIPRTFPPYPDNLHFDIYATMSAAKDVGGDFYDFFPIGADSDNDHGKMAFIMADVSGKGIPAALFMMQAKTQIRDYLESGMEISEAIANANHQLCDGNTVGMFVTAWVGVLDYGTGHIDFVNAGHNPPMVWQHGTRRWSWLTKKSGLPLGLFDDGIAYRAHSIDLLPGETLFLYTDGVTEAFSADAKQFGEDRLEAVLNEHRFEHPREICGIVRKAVAEHAAGAEQSDDITMLALEYGVPPEITAVLTVPAEIGSLDAVNEFLHTELDRRLCPLRTQKQMDIAVEELFANICMYAYADRGEDGKQGMVRVSYTYSSEPPSVIVSLADEGIPYNPLEGPDASAMTADDMSTKGLGLLLAKRNVDSMDYERAGGSNILTITKRWR